MEDDSDPIDAPPVDTNSRRAILASMMSGNTAAPMPVSHAVAAPSAPPVETGVPSGLPSSAPSLTAPPVQPNRPQAQVNQIGKQPDKKDYQPIITHPLLRRIGVGLAAFGMGPQAGAEAYKNAFVAPVQHAHQAYEDDTQAYNERLKGMNEQETQDREAPLQAAQTRKANAEADAATEPKDVVKEYSHALAVGDMDTADRLEPMVKRYNAATQKPEKGTEGELPLGDTAAHLNQINTDRYQVLNPGKPLPPEFTLTPKSTQKDYDRADKGLAGVEGAVGQKANRETAAATRTQAQSNKNTAEDRKQTLEVTKEARGIIQKAQTTMGSARDSANALDGFIDLASKGNKEAAATVPLEGTLAIVTSQGVKRINKTEVEGIQGAGSLFDVIQSKVGKLATGQSMPPDLLADMKELSQVLKKNAYKHYSDTYDDTRSLYEPGGADFSKLKKLEDKDGGGSGKLSVDEARVYLQKAGGDKDKARALAKADKREF